MKTLNQKGVQFGFSAVHAGQRNVVVEPQVIAVSTDGGFRITPPVSRVLNIEAGANVMFVNNVENINAAIATRDELVVAFCEEQGLEFGSPESIIAIHKEFDMWGIAKGIKEYDTKGNVRTTSERLTKNDKAKFVSQNFDEMLQSALEQGDDEVRTALTREGITQDEQAEILTAFVTPREMPKYKGSKTANTSGMTGTGVSLQFTDSNVWKQLKADLSEDADQVNRVFDVDLENIQTVTLNNGFEDVTVPVLILGDYTDKEPARIGSKED